MRILKQTPILVVDAIEPLLPFWTDTLGYQKLADVAHEGRLGFVMLERDGNMLMLQTEASIVADLTPSTKTGMKTGATLLYLDVDSIDEAVALVRKSGATIIAGPRETSYGAKEIWAVAPGGFVTGFAEHKQ
jgi:uncharacterized glyoxalase superfamily protein PhnB